MFMLSKTDDVVKVEITTSTGQKYVLTDDEGIREFNDQLKDIRSGDDDDKFINFYPDEVDVAHGVFEDVFLHVDHLVEVKFLRELG